MTASNEASLAGRPHLAVDLFKAVAALLVIAIHTGPLQTYSEQADFLLTGIAARLAVPFFFLASGCFFFRKAIAGNGSGWKDVHRYAAKTGKLYAVAIILYIPLNWYSGYFASPDFSLGPLAKDLVFDGTLYHLWYLPASILGMYIAYACFRYGSMNAALPVTGCLYAIGLLGDSYYGIAAGHAWLASLYDSLFALFDYTRNGIFFAPLYMALGALAAKRAESRPPSLKASAAWLFLSLALLFAEGMTLHGLEWPRHDSMYVALVPAVYCLYQCLLAGEARLQLAPAYGPYLRQLSTWIYIGHPAVIVLVRFIAKMTDSTRLLVNDSLVHFVAVSILSVLISMLGIAVSNHCRGKRRRRNDGNGGVKNGANHYPASGAYRAWAEISLDSLRHNLDELRRVLPPHYGIMAVVKANAYGHGSVLAARHFEQLGIRSFAVAEIGEAIELRKGGVKGEVLILGFTDPSLARELARYKLTQTVVSAEYGERLAAAGIRLNVHVKIDTGMNRLGVPYGDVRQLLCCYRHKLLRVTGTFSHLSVSDSRLPEHIDFTRLQLRRFDEAVAWMKDAGCDPGVLHIQSSYGILNYASEGAFDLARPGIALYGLTSSEADMPKADIRLRPALSLRAAVTRVKEIPAHCPVGYGHAYLPDRDVRIATVSIGYADGVPRELAERGGEVLIRGRRARIQGIICMDQMIVDVTPIEDVQPGDTVTIIGEDGDERITAGEIAARCHTLTNDIVSLIGSRVARVYIA